MLNMNALSSGPLGKPDFISKPQRLVLHIPLERSRHGGLHRHVFSAPSPQGLMRSHLREPLLVGL